MKKEGEIMANVLNKINDINIPPQIEKAIGLKKNWKKEISPKDISTIVNSANKYKEALRKLSEN